jgi:hypothetical protein
MPHYRQAKNEMHDMRMKKKQHIGWITTSNLSDSRSWSKVASFTSGISPLTLGVCCQHIEPMSIHMIK